MRWQNNRKWIVKHIIILLVGALSTSLAPAQELIFGAGELKRGIFSPDGSLLAVQTAAEKVLVFDTGSLWLIKTLSTPGRSVYTLAFSSDSRYLAWNERTPGGGVGVWELSTSQQVAHFQLGAFHLGALVFVPGGELLAAQAGDYVGIGTPDPGIVHLWKVGTWAEHGTWRPTGNGTVSSLAFTHDGEQFVASSTRGPVGEWIHEEFVVDVQTLKMVDSRQSHDAGIIAYSPDGSFEVVPVNGGSRSVLIRDPQDHAQIAFLSDPVMGYMFFRSISPDSKWLATQNLEEIVIWNTQTWEIEHRFNLPDGQLIAHGFVKDTYWCADLAPTGELRLWDLMSQNRLIGVFLSVSPGIKVTSWGDIRMIR